MSSTDTAVRTSPETPFSTRKSRPTGGRALVWDSTSTSSVIVARALRRQGWTVDWLGTERSPWRRSDAFNGERTLIRGHDDPRLERLLHEHPLDALTLHGDEDVRWMLARWSRLPATARRHLPEPLALETALSKELSMQLAASLGVPVLATERCTTPDEVSAASRRLVDSGDVVVKGEGGAAGSCVRALRRGMTPSREVWQAVAGHDPNVLVQPRLRGPRQIVVVAYESGIERAACSHEKILTWPRAFGPTAVGFTRQIATVHDYAQRMFSALRWHGIADIEFRQDLRDGRWYYMEISPRVPSCIGLQALAGVDVVASWAAICAGRGEEQAPGRAYRDGVRYAWSTRALALALGHPWSVRPSTLRCVAGQASDLADLGPALRVEALRQAFWFARHPGSH